MLRTVWLAFAIALRTAWWMLSAETPTTSMILYVLSGMTRSCGNGNHDFAGLSPIQIGEAGHGATSQRPPAKGTKSSRFVQSAAGMDKARLFHFANSTSRTPGSSIV